MSEDKIPEASAAIPVGAPGAVPMSEQEKLGAKCCGCCCDFRRAVVALGVIGIVTSLIQLIFAAMGTSLAAIGSNNADDDGVAANFQVATGIGAIYSITFAVAVLGYIWQVCAALRYSVCMLCCVILVSLYRFAVTVYYQVESSQSAADGSTTALIVNIIVSVFFCGLTIYPVVGLISEIKKGIMSKETYPREAYSCCCQPKPQ